MGKPRPLLTLALALAATVGTARAASVRDKAGLFSADAVRQAEAELNRVERETQLATTIETIGSLEGENVVAVTERHDEQSATPGLFVLIANKENKIDVKASKSFRQAIDGSRREKIQDAFIAELKKRDFDAALLQGVKAIRSEASAAKAELGSLRQGRPPARRVGAGGPVVPVGRGVNPNRGGFGLGSLLGIGLVIIGVLFVVRLLGSLFGAGRGYAGQPGRMGAPGYGGGGGGGGGFMSSLFGGIGGAMAGNWLYDQFSGRHGGGSVDSSTYGDAGGTPASGADEWSGGGDTTGDWSGGDAGGGGGDWGGGGGDGGGGGGGDW